LSTQITRLKETTEQVAWYGASQRKMRCFSDTSPWYDNRANAATPIRWVWVCGEPQARLEDACFFCSDPAMAAGKIIEHYARRWNIEVIFEEVRVLLGLETTRHWCKKSVLRVTPILFGLFTATALIWRQLPAARKRVISTAMPCYAKHTITFADALAAVRKELWQATLMQHRGKSGCFMSLPKLLRNTLLWHLSAAA
jgi:hypothetical protein